MIPAGPQIWIAAGVTDLRRGFTGLSAAVQTKLEGMVVFRLTSLLQRNLFEGSVMFFLISAVSVLRAGAAPKPN
jgi:hypothetical protein